ncbi:hypothetical protein [Paenibacillus hamazuiensis]|uniref:hypothetical protein n=1 Tax=Paenibacillus hamazuiensis TaxID=2936508 RepID=UPI00200D25CD|nr:hypothetical protein [Paenibacillus hamazuiensis]
MKSFGSLMVLIAILCAFIAGFHWLSGLSFRDGASYLTVLDKDLFKVQSTNNEENPFAVSKIVRYTIPFHLLESDLLSMNTIVFTRPNPQMKYSVETGFYDMSKNMIIGDPDQQNQVRSSSISVSADGKMILVSYIGTDDKLNVTYVYDAAANKKLYALDGTFSAQWLPDGIRFIGMDDYLFVQDAKSGKREDLLKISEFAGKNPKTSLSLTQLKDGRTVCLYYNNDNTRLLTVDLETKKQSKISLKGQFFDAVPVGDTKLAATGLFQDQYGIFLYDMKSDTPEPLIDLKNQKVTDMSVSQDGKKLAYSVVKSDTAGYGTEIHALSLNDNQIVNHEVIYKESNQFIDKLIWSKDSQMLICYQRNTDGAAIYRISFNP